MNNEEFLYFFLPSVDICIEKYMILCYNVKRTPMHYECYVLLIYCETNA